MNRKHVLNMVSRLLEIAGDTFSNHGCNDLPSDFFDVAGMDDDDIKELYREWHDWESFFAEWLRK